MSEQVDLTGSGIGSPWVKPHDASRPVNFGMTARDRVARELRHRILLGSLSKGDRIDLGALAEEFGTSRTPIREATLELANDNLVKLAPRSGVTVLGITASDLLDNFEIMAELAGMAAGWAAERATPEDLDRIQTFCAAVVAAAESGGDVTMANFEFHRSVNQASHSSRVMALIAQSARLFPDRFSDVVPAQVPCSLRQHAELVDAIMQRNTSQSRLLMVTHFQDAAARLRSHLDRGHNLEEDDV